MTRLVISCFEEAEFGTERVGGSGKAPCFSGRERDAFLKHSGQLLRGEGALEQESGKFLELRIPYAVRASERECDG
jgi:hypothetical protein